MLKNINVEFLSNPTNLKILSKPNYAYKYIPEWYKKLKPQVPNLDKSDVGTAKRCMPMLDAMSLGYIIPLWADLSIKVYTEDNEKKIIVKMPNPNNLYHAIGNHMWQQVGEPCTLKKFDLGKTLFKFYNPWIIKTPKNWSVYVKNPPNSWNNNIEIIEGVVDTDRYYQEINFPFAWTGGEEGETIIEAGTPLVHIIPFERKVTKLNFNFSDKEKYNLDREKITNLFINQYKNLWRAKRDKK